MRAHTITNVRCSAVYSSRILCTTVRSTLSVIPKLTGYDDTHTGHGPHRRGSGTRRTGSHIRTSTLCHRARPRRICRARTHIHTLFGHIESDIGAITRRLSGRVCVFVPCSKLPDIPINVCSVFAFRSIGPGVSSHVRRRYQHRFGARERAALCTGNRFDTGRASAHRVSGALTKLPAAGGIRRDERRAKWPGRPITSANAIVSDSLSHLTHTRTEPQTWKREPMKRTAWHWTERLLASAQYE